MNGSRICSLVAVVAATIAIAIPANAAPSRTHVLHGQRLCENFRTSTYNICSGGSISRGGKLFHYEFRTGDLPAVHPTFETFLHASHSTCTFMSLQWTSSSSDRGEHSYLRIISDSGRKTVRVDKGKIGHISAHLPGTHGFIVRVSGNRSGAHMDIAATADCRTASGR